MRTESRSRCAGQVRFGGALLTALVFVALVASMTAAVLQVSTAMTRRRVQDTDQLRAFYLAEAGLGEAFTGLRMGKKGQIASAAAPALFGDGLLWVDATETADGQVRLESTAICGRGLETLALVVERVEEPLGIFSDEDLLVEDILLVDGFDSDAGTYQAQTLPEGPSTPDCGGKDLGDGKIKFKKSKEHTHDTKNRIVYYNGRAYHYDEYDVDDGEVQLKYGHSYNCTGPDPQEADLPVSPTGATTGAGGLVGSNGSIILGGTGSAVDVFGDVIPGAGETMTLGPGGTVSGNTQARDNPLELPPVEVPAVALLGPVKHTGALPMVVSPGTSGYQSIDVAPDAELVIRGPGTVVIGSLSLQAGATLTLDTRDGDVELFITAGLDLAAGSTVTTSGVRADELSLQVDAIDSAGGEAPVQLRADSQFYGTIYAPDTEVALGASFELYGALVARSLDLEPGVRLHYDETAADAMPRIVSWRVVESPAAARALLGNPLQVLGLNRGQLRSLSAAHDLAGIVLDIRYLDSNGNELTYRGTESEFDWSTVATCLEVTRNGRPGEIDTPAGDGEPEAGATPQDQELIDFINGGNSSSKVKDMLVANSPVSESVWHSAFYATKQMSSGDFKKSLIANSPLPSGILDLVIADEPSVMSSGDRGKVLAAQ